MNLNALRRRIERSNLKEYSREYFRDNNSQIVKKLNDQGKKAYVGIQENDGIYTLAGNDFIYYSTNSGSHREILLEEFSEALHSETLIKGKKANYEFLKICGGHEIWLHNKSTMNAFWNIVLWIQDQD